MQIFYKENEIKSLLLFLSIIILFHTELNARNADDLYREGRFAEAEKEYQKADMDNPKDIRYRYNRGCSAFQNSDYKTAEAAFSSVLKRAKDKDILYKAAYNLGNTAYMQNNFAAAAELYKQAIIHNPDSSEAKYNLELTLNRLEQEKKQQGDNKDQSNKNNDNNKDSPDNKKNNRGDQNKKKKNEEDKKQDNRSEDQSSANPDNKQMKANKTSNLDRQKAEALLDNIKEDRAKILKLQMRDQEKNVHTGKNW